jgi:hypothetical protein
VSDLAERLVVAIERDEKVANRAMQGRYRWAEAVGFITDDYTDDDLEAAELHASHHAPSIVLTHCGGHREIVRYYQATVSRYKELKSHDLLTTEQQGELRLVEARIADFVAIILPALARGYGVQPTPGDDHA